MSCSCLGEDVVVVGYGALGGSCGPSLTSGILSRVITHQSQPVMLQTTCAVQSGASGGAVVRPSTGELLGNVIYWLNQWCECGVGLFLSVGGLKIVIIFAILFCAISGAEITHFNLN